MTPLVSICIPTYNSSSTIIETLESVSAQTYDNIEIILIDDCSPDDSFKVAKTWLDKSGLKFTAEKNKQNLGVVKTCNRMIGIMQGEFFQILGADDILLTNKISEQVKQLSDSGTDWKISYSDVQVIDEKGALLSDSYVAEHGYNRAAMPFGKIFPELLRFDFIAAPSALVRSNVFEDFGKYDEGLAFEDYDLFLRVSEKYSIAYFPEPLALYRRHCRSLMHSGARKTEMIHSLLVCLQKFSGRGPDTDRVIQKRISDLAPALYRYRHPAGKYWLSQRLKYNKGIKSWLYSFMGLFNTRFLWRGKA